MPLRVEGELLGAAQLWVAPICSNCRPWSAAGRQPRPCSGCGRGVIADADDYWPWAGHVFCSDRCAASWWDVQRHEGADLVQPGAGGLQAVPRSSSCLACGRPVLGRRTTCGVACRQRLYRLRKRSSLLADGLITAPAAAPVSPILASVPSHLPEHDPTAA
jgi:predicted nucleic acid-binding Zn ribbon protein